jgi:anti-sigma regulatory factor (Ser/Thr protein kinase)
MKAETKIFAAVVENLTAANAFIEECADRFGLAAEKKFGLLLALEEIFVNICHYAYPDGAGDAEIACSDDGDLFVLEISDSGRPFDVLSRPEPDTELDIMDRPIGGLGIHLVRKLSDAVSYRRQDERNILRMEFRR